MKTKIFKSLLILASAFLFSSCADSKDKVVDDMATLIQEQAQAVLDGDQSKLEKLQSESEAIMKRAKALGIDPLNPATLSDEQRKKLEDAGKKALNESMNKLQDKIFNK